jgi:hypothetical protein
MNPQVHTSIESVGTIAGKTAYLSAAYTGFIGWIGSSNFAVMTGFFIALATFLISWYYRHQDNMRDKERHRLDVQERLARLEQLRNGAALPPLCEVIKRED